VAGLGAAAGALFGRPGRIAHAAAPATAQATDWQAFDAAVQDAMGTFDIVGAAVAAVNTEGIVHRRTFGVRDRASGAPAGTPIRLVRDQTGTLAMELEGFETVRWLSGPP
jgi:CubicO group peptidase (beta-lactamase class C family)